MAERVKVCTQCHGAQGRAGPYGYYPRLAGKPAGYLYNQLLNIRDGRRHYLPMAKLLEPLSNDYLMAMADYFAKLNLPYAAPKSSNASVKDLDRGRVLVTQGDKNRQIPPCQQCHGENLTGALPFVPGLLGLSGDYLNAQLGGWRTGQRQAQAPDCMGLIASHLRPQDIYALTAWLAAQPVSQHDKPLISLPQLGHADQAMDCGSFKSVATPSRAMALTVKAKQGAYLAKLGNCQTCHTAPGGQLFAGGRALQTPFGVAYSSNLTADLTHGLGQWTADDFWQAMHQGKSRDGRLLSPAFPYTEFTRITRSDSDALFAYFQTLPAQPIANRPHEMRWPFGTQLALFAWRTLFFSSDSFKPQSNQSRQWNRGAYLVNSLGHCSSCHTPRNLLGATQKAQSLSGSMMPVSNWYAPSLLDSAQAGAQLSQSSDLITFFKSGHSQHATASGPMALVVQGSTQYWNDADLQALQIYLQSLSHFEPNTKLAVTNAQLAQTTTDLPDKLGQTLYNKHCLVCHGAKGQGQPPMYPALAGNRALLMSNSTNVIQTVLNGGFAPATQQNPQPFGMPPFILTLTDEEIATVLTYVRNAWGNRADKLSSYEVHQLRDR